MIDVTTIRTPSLGDRSYLATDGVAALVVDPQRDIDRVLAIAAARGVPVTHVFETHIHNDYLSGGLALGQMTGVTYHVNAADVVAFDRAPVADDDVLTVGASMRVRVIATPGHTFTHLAYALEDAATGQVIAVFTGGSLLYGATGARGVAAADLASPAPADPGEVRRRIAARQWVVDLRQRRAFASGHIPGSLSFEHGDSLVSNLGWLLPPRLR